MALVLTRKAGQRIFINGSEVKIAILGINGNQVRIGIEAPQSVSVHREEIFHRIKKEQEDAH